MLMPLLSSSRTEPVSAQSGWVTLGTTRSPLLGNVTELPPTDARFLFRLMERRLESL